MQKRTVFIKRSILAWWFHGLSFLIEVWISPWQSYIFLKSRNSCFQRIFSVAAFDTFNTYTHLTPYLFFFFFAAFTSSIFSAAMRSLGNIRTNIFEKRVRFIRKALNFIKIRASSKIFFKNLSVLYKQPFTRVLQYIRS